MHASILVLKGSPEEKMHCLNFTIDSETGTCANIFGSLKNSPPWHAQGAADALMPV